MGTRFTPADLAAARAAIAALEALPAPDAMQLRKLRQDARTIELLLQANGLLPFESGNEPIEKRLDRMYPHARNREVVEAGGQRYMRRIAPGERTAEGGVKTWRKTWLPV